MYLLKRFQVRHQEATRPALFRFFVFAPLTLDFSPESRWKSLALHGVDPGEIYGHTIVHHAPSDSLYLFGGSSRTGTFHNNVIRFHLGTSRGFTCHSHALSRSSPWLWPH